MMKSFLFIVVICFAQIVLAQNPYITITVAQDGSGQFSSVQKAINSLRDFGPGEALIKIKSGIYNEKVVIPSWKQNVTLQGESAENTIIRNDDYSGKLGVLNEKMTTFNSYTLLVMGDNVKISNLTIQNTWCNKGQAVSLHVEGDKFIIKDSKILGCQDTVFASGRHSRQYYDNCFVEGTTDFIFGSATVVFNNCTIKSLADSYITAASTDQDKKYGFVFFDCKLIARDGVKKVFLGRPWRSFAKTVFINTIMGSHILPEGWNPWKGDKMFRDKEKTVFYAEYESSGGGGDTSQRVSWSHQLSKKELKNYNISKIFVDWDPRK